MEKTEKIQEAYGDYWEQVKSFINDDGWVNRDLLRIDNINNFDVKSTYNRFDSVRPKSLQGIENNNGWIKIESEADLPKEEGSYFIFYKNIITQSSFLFEEQTWQEALKRKEITHYQPITKPNPPIY